MQTVLHQTQLDAALSADSDSLLSVSQIPSSTSPCYMLMYLLPPCVLLVALDAAIRSSQAPHPLPVKEEAPAPTPKRKDGALARVLADVNALERQLELEEKRSHQEKLCRKRRNFAHHRRRMAHAQRQGLVSPTIPKSVPCAAADANDHPEPDIAPSFIAFCERLLLENRLWKQQREIKALRQSLDSVRTAGGSNAFQAFCDRLILTNNIWKLQKEVDRLTVETEKLRRSRVVAVTRAAKQMVLDVRKERMIEEYVKDLIDEVAECRQTVKDLRIQHDLELQEMAEVFKKEHRRMTNRIEQLKLAQEARLVEQGISNELESELVGRLSMNEKQMELFKKRIEENSRSANDEETMSDTELEVMSNMSSTTCVDSLGNLSPGRRISFGGEAQGKKATDLRRRASLASLKLHLGAAHPSPQSSPSGKSPLRRVDSGSYAGFSFNPLFFGPAASGDPEHVQKRSSIVLSSPRHDVFVGQTEKASGPGNQSSHVVLTAAPKRPQWRI